MALPILYDHGDRPQACRLYKKAPHPHRDKEFYAYFKILSTSPTFVNIVDMLPAHLLVLGAHLPLSALLMQFISLRVACRRSAG